MNVVGARGLGGGDDVVDRRVGPTVRDVVSDRDREEERLVEDHADVVAQARQRDVADVAAVDPHRAIGDVVEASEQARDGALAGAGAPDDGDGLTRVQVQIEVLEHVGAVGVVEGHVVEVHVAGALDDVDRAGAVDDGRLLVEHLEDAPRRRRRALAHHHHHAELTERRLEHQDVGVERDDVPDGRLPVDREIAAVEQHQRLTETGKVLDERRPVRPDVGVLDVRPLGALALRR